MPKTILHIEVRNRRTGEVKSRRTVLVTKEQSDSLWEWTRQEAARGRATFITRPASTGPATARIAPRPRAPRRARRSTGTAESRGDPPGDDGDPDADPVDAAVARLLDTCPPFSPGQRDLLGRILGGAR